MIEETKRSTGTVNDILDVGHYERRLPFFSSGSSVAALVSTTSSEIYVVLRPQQRPGSGGDSWDMSSAVTVGKHLLSGVRSGNVVASAVDLRGVEWNARTWDSHELASRFIKMFDVEPLESGFEHPVEAILLKVLQSAPEIAAETVARVINESSVVAPQLIRCAGRLPGGLALKPLLPFVKDALRSPDIVLRDAAVSALEGWGGAEAADLLETHTEPVAWLSDYIRRVIRDLRQ